MIVFLSLSPFGCKDVKNSLNGKRRGRQSVQTESNIQANLSIVEWIRNMMLNPKLQKSEAFSTRDSKGEVAVGNRAPP
jgi:hypothetical protein